MEHGADEPHAAGITSSYTAHTIMADDLVAYQHEVLNAYPADVPLPWAETFDLNLNSGAEADDAQATDSRRSGAVRRICSIRCSTETSRSVALDASLAVQDREAPRLQTDAAAGAASNGYVDFRVTARDIRLRIEVGAPPGRRRGPG